jgi:hypothetical protein
MLVVMDTAACHSSAIRHLASAVSGFLSDWAYAQHRLAEILTAPDRLRSDPDTPPETYAEFLFRTSGVLHREPPARARIRCN